MTTVVFLIECGSCKTEIARDLIATALDTGVPRVWVRADAPYRLNSGLRRTLG
jgi:SRSO17 transposase